ncbi:hypothetical protein LguiA_030691 [Lonicera macranthoides]
MAIWHTAFKSWWPVFRRWPVSRWWFVVASKFINEKKFTWSKSGFVINTIEEVPEDSKGVKSTGAGDGFDSVPPFIKKIFAMVDGPETNSLISWSSSGASFIVWDE